MLADVVTHKMVRVLFFLLYRICHSDMLINSIMLMWEVCVDIKEKDHPGQRSVKLRQCGVIGFHGWLALQTFRQRSDQEVFIALRGHFYKSRHLAKGSSKHCQRHNGPEGWVHLAKVILQVSTQILIEFHLHNLDSASTKHQHLHYY